MTQPPKQPERRRGAIDTLALVGAGNIFIGIVLIAIMVAADPTKVAPIGATALVLAGVFLIDIGVLFAYLAWRGK
jgi:hypothetical protein